MKLEKEFINNSNNKKNVIKRTFKEIHENVNYVFDNFEKYIKLYKIKKIKKTKKEKFERDEKIKTNSCSEKAEDY